MLLRDFFFIGGFFLMVSVINIIWEKFIFRYLLGFVFVRRVFLFVVFGRYVSLSF